MISRSLFVENKKLIVYDFDDTLVKTNSFIYVSNIIHGIKRKLTPGQYAVYTPREGDVFDYTDFDKVHEPSEIKHVTDDLRRISTKAGRDSVFILTARSKYKPVKRYLKDIGINTNKVFIVALGDSNPQKKSDWIEEMIDERGYDDIFFMDDSEKNIKAVKRMLRRKSVKSKVIHIKH